MGASQITVDVVKRLSLFLQIETLFYGELCGSATILRASYKSSVGAYVALFCICVHILYRRKRVIFMITTITMFSLSTAHVTLHILRAERNLPGLDKATYIISIINKSVISLTWFCDFLTVFTA